MNSGSNAAFAMTVDFRIVIDAEMDDRKDRLYVDDVELVSES